MLTCGAKVNTGCRCVKCRLFNLQGQSKLAARTQSHAQIKLLTQRTIQPPGCPQCCSNFNVTNVSVTNISGSNISNSNQTGKNSLIDWCAILLFAVKQIPGNKPSKSHPCNERLWWTISQQPPRDITKKSSPNSSSRKRKCRKRPGLTTNSYKRQAQRS